MKRLILIPLLLLPLGGCRKASTPSDYRFKQVKNGPTLDEEIAFLRGRVKQTPNNFIEQNALAGAYLAKAQSSGDSAFFLLAQKTAQESLRLQPTQNPAAQLILASVNEARHEFGASLELARSVYQVDPSSLEAYSLMSNSLLELGKLEESRKFSLAAARAMPTSAALVQLARVEMAAGRDDKARELLNAALKVEQPGEVKSSARIRSLLGEMELRLGHRSEARRLLRQSVEIMPAHLPGIQALARLELREGHLHEAEQFFSQAFGYSQNPALLTEVAYIKQLSGEEKAAQELRAKAEAQLRPEIKEGKFGHARDLARLLLDRGDAASIQEAVKILEQEKKQRNDVRLLELLGQAYQAANQPDKARAAWQAAVATGIREPLLYARLASLSQPPDGVLLEKAKAIDPTFQLEWTKR